MGRMTPARLRDFRMTHSVAIRTGLTLRMPKSRMTPPRPMGRAHARLIPAPSPSPPARTVTMKVASAEVMPRFPATMRCWVIFRLTLCVTTSSDSAVVNPTPKNAEIAWKLAVSRGRPVIMRAMAPMRTMRNATPARKKSAMSENRKFMVRAGRGRGGRPRPIPRGPRAAARRARSGGRVRTGRPCRAP